LFRSGSNGVSFGRRVLFHDGYLIVGAPFSDDLVSQPAGKRGYIHIYSVSESTAHALYHVRGTDQDMELGAFLSAYDVGGGMTYLFAGTPGYLSARGGVAVIRLNSTGTELHHIFVGFHASSQDRMGPHG
jgi:hypothetical protein